MSKIFISYNRQSEAMARSLVNDIESLGYVVWFDQELSGGQAWWDQILAMVRDCDVFVFLLDQKALNSTACKREFGYAADLGKPILPVLVAEGVSTNLLPAELSRIQFIDYRKQDRNTAFSLARALASIPPSKPLPDPLPPPPEVPVSYLGSLTRKVDTASTLSYEEQSALVVDLRRSLRDLEAADDTRTLLERLRNRRDLFATIAEEINDLLVSPRKASISASSVSDTELSSLERSKMEDTTAALAESKLRQGPVSKLVQEALPQPTLIIRRRGLFASLTAFLFFVVGWAAGYTINEAAGMYYLSLWVAIAIWILGLIFGILAWHRGRLFGLI